MMCDGHDAPLPDPEATMSEQGDLSMTFTGRLNLIVAYAALAFVGAIVLGLF